MKTFTDNEIDRRLIRPNRIIMAIFGNLILETARKLINRSKERGHITSHAYHELHTMIDRSLK